METAVNNRLKGKVGQGVMGQTKLAPKNMKMDKTFQWCMDSILVDETLDDLPKGITIIGAKVRLGSPFTRARKIISTKLKKMGVTYLSSTVPSVEAVLVFDQVAKGTIKQHVKAAAKEIGADYERAYFQYITLTNGQGTGKFQRTTKEMRPDDRDLRKKAVVLGLTEGEAKVQSLISDLSANKYFCKKQTIEVTTVLCSK